MAQGLDSTRRTTTDKARRTQGRGNSTLRQTCDGLRDPCLCPCVVRSWTVGGFGTRRHGRGEFSRSNDPPMAYKVRGMEFIELPVFTHSPACLLIY